MKIHYAYTYIHNGKRIFRYDNAPHHPEVKTFPHHKHVGVEELLSETQEPNLAQILTEIRTMLQNE